VLFPRKRLIFFFNDSRKEVLLDYMDMSKLYPTISLGSPDEEVKVNIGSEPFLFYPNGNASSFIEVKIHSKY